MRHIHTYVGSLKNTIDDQEGNYAAAYYAYLENEMNERYYPNYINYSISKSRAATIENRCHMIYNKEYP